MGGLKLTFRLGNRKNVQGEEESNDGFGRCGPNNKERAHCGSSRPETQVAKLRSSPVEQKAKDYHTTSTMASMKKIPEAFVMKGVPKALSAATQAERRNLPLKSGREVKITRETPLSFVAGSQTKVSQDPNSKKDSTRHASRSSQQTSAAQKYIAAKDGGTTSGKRRRDADAASTLKEKVSNLGEEVDEKVLSDDRIFARVLRTIPSASPPEKSTLNDLIKELQLGDENNIFSTEGTAPEVKTSFQLDFLTLSANVSAGKYIDWDGFIYDMERIFHNALMHIPAASTHNKVVARMSLRSKMLIEQARMSAGILGSKHIQVKREGDGVSDIGGKGAIKKRTFASRVTDTFLEEEHEDRTFAHGMTRQEVGGNRVEGSTKRRKFPHFKRCTFSEARCPKQISVILPLSERYAPSILASTKLVHPTNFYFQAQLLPESYREQMKRWCLSTRKHTNQVTAGVLEETVGYISESVPDIVPPIPPKLPTCSRLKNLAVHGRESRMIPTGNPSVASIDAKATAAENNDTSVPHFATIVETTSQVTALRHAAVIAGRKAQVMANKAVTILSKDNDNQIHEARVNPLVTILSKLSLTFTSRTGGLEDIVRAIHANLTQQMLRMKK